MKYILHNNIQYYSVFKRQEEFITGIEDCLNILDFRYWSFFKQIVVISVGTHYADFLRTNEGHSETNAIRIFSWHFVMHVVKKWRYSLV